METSSTAPGSESSVVSLTPIPENLASEWQLWKERSSRDPRLQHFSETRLRVLFLRMEAEKICGTD